MRKVDVPEIVAPTQKRKPVTIPRRTRRPALPKEHLEALELAKWARKAKRLPAVRKELIARVKAQIEAGGYETPDKLDAAIAGLLRDLAEA